MPNDPAPDQSERRTHFSHLLAVRFSPYFLALIGLFLVLFAAFGGKPEAEAITMLVLGVGCCIGGAVVTRADELKVGKNGIEAKLSSALQLDPGEIAFKVQPAEASTDDPPKSRPMRLLSSHDVIKEAMTDGWSMKSDGGNHVTLTKTVREAVPGVPAGVGDVLTVVVPISTEPIPPGLQNALERLGLTTSLEIDRPRSTPAGEPPSMTA